MTDEDETHDDALDASGRAEIRCPSCESVMVKIGACWRCLFDGLSLGCE